MMKNGIVNMKNGIVDDGERVLKRRTMGMSWEIPPCKHTKSYGKAQYLIKLGKSTV